MTFPRRLSLKKLRNRTLSTDVVELIGGHGQVRIDEQGRAAVGRAIPVTLRRLEGAASAFEKAP